MVCSEGYYYSNIAQECICEFKGCLTVFFCDPIHTALDSVYRYEPTILEGCDPDRNAEYRSHIEAEIEALVNEYFENAP